MASLPAAICNRAPIVEDRSWVAGPRGVEGEGDWVGPTKKIEKKGN